MSTDLIKKDSMENINVNTSFKIFSHKMSNMAMSKSFFFNLLCFLVLSLLVFLDNTFTG